MIGYVRKVACQFRQLAAKVSKGTATERERQEYEYGLKTLVCAVCIVSISLCLVFCFIQKAVNL